MRCNAVHDAGQGLTVCVVDFVKQNLANKIVVYNMAAKCGMSKSHFSRTFKKEHDITFQEFLIQQRMNNIISDWANRSSQFQSAYAFQQERSTRAVQGEDVISKVTLIIML